SLEFDTSLRLRSHVWKPMMSTSDISNQRSDMPPASYLDRFTHERYLIRTKFFKIFGEAFHVYDDTGEVVLYSKMKAFKLKEDIRLYTGADMQTELLTISARSIMDLGATYDVVDPIAGVKVGALRRKFMKSLLRDEWHILNE